MLYDLTFVIEGADPTDDGMVAALAEELDASLARGAGVDLLLITAEGTSAVNAAQNAMRSVQYLAPQIRFQYLDRDIVGISEIAERTGRSRQNVTQWVNGERHAASSTPFPKVEGVVGRARIWLWSEVNAWLRMLGLGDAIPGPRRHEITDIDFLIRHRDWLTRNSLTVDPEGSEFPPRGQVNWELLRQLYDRPHPLVNNEMDMTGLHFGIVELLYEAKAVHHLLDLAGVPQGYGMDTRAIDCRTLLAILAMGNLRERLARISGWHARETGPAGMVGDYCTECGHRWPCDTRRMADGTYTDPDE